MTLSIDKDEQVHNIKKECIGITMKHKPQYDYYSDIKKS